ncbi:MAG TPA: MlaD family protein [Rhodanobacteraceae bacterium]|jgi:phospholipid/cholesterol/gamma-HCH transport system substrate-binding protein|nr:MlaD family protein [Rhodanobacteraceae bacterium]
MENRAHAIAAVAFLLVFSIGAIVVYYWLANRHNEPLVYEVVTSESVAGLSAQSEVQFKGIVVGHVASLGFDPHDRARVVMRLQLQPDTYVTHATYAVVAMQGLTGGSVLELKLGKGSDAPLATSAAHPARIPMQAGVLASLMTEAPQVLHDLQAVLGNANKLLDTGNREHVTASLAQIDAVTRQLAAIESKLPALLAELQQSVADTDRLVRSAQTPVRNATELEASIDALAQSSRQLSERLNRQTAPDFDALSASLQGTSEQLNLLLRELQAKPQSLIFGPPTRPPGPGEPGFDGHDTGKHANDQHGKGKQQP